MITVISSTNRINSNSSKVANVVVELLKQTPHEHTLLSLEQLPHDFLFSHFNNQSNPNFQHIIDTYIVPAKRFIFVVPEYNGAFPGILKAFLDCTPPRHLWGKQAHIIGVSTGHAGALRALDMFTLVLNHLKVNVHWNKPKLSDIENHFTDNTMHNNYVERLKSLIGDLA